jgi:hypothetical protein
MLIPEFDIEVSAVRDCAACESARNAGLGCIDYQPAFARPSPADTLAAQSAESCSCRIRSFVGRFNASASAPVWSLLGNMMNHWQAVCRFRRTVPGDRRVIPLIGPRARRPSVDE